MRVLLLAAMVVSLAACASGNREAGANVDDGTFGNATMNNTLVQTGTMDYRMALGQRFAGEVPSTITFPFNSSQLTAEARAALDHQANWMRQFPELRFSVYGHTDLVGSNAYNKSLGLRRAQTAVAYLGSRGISRSRLDALVSYGETRPVVVTQAPEQQNRRTVTEVAGFVKGSAAPLNGKYAAIIWRNYIALGQRPHPSNHVVQTELSDSN
ncbi:OmpA family protein [Gemmobacter aquatilis]|nr:OmpA family protein [Gemmobacter aquatilis]